MRTIYFPAMVLGLILLQSTVLNYITLGGIKPDLILVLVILNGFLRGTREGAFLGFVGGVMQDLVSGGYFGLYTLSSMTAGYLGGLGEGRLYRDNRIIASGLTWFCTFGAQLVFYLLLTVVGVRVQLLTALTGIIIPVSFYNALAALLLYGLYYRSHHQGLLGDGQY